MDISVLSGAATAGAQPRSSSQSPSASTEGSFARRLEQAVGQADRTQSATASDPSPRPSNAAPAAVPADDTATATASTAASPAPAPAPAPDTHTPTGILPPPPLAEQLLPVAAAVGTPPDSLAAIPTPQLDTLDEIRRRLALIEQAGQLPDAAATAAAFATPPIQATPLVTRNAQAPDASPNAPLDALSNLAARNGSDPHTQPAPQVAAAATQPTSAATTSTSTGSGAEPIQLENSFSMPPRGEPTSTALFAPNSGTLAPGTSTPPVSPPLATLAAPLGSHDWQQGLGQQLLGLHQRGEQHIELHLHPSDLGPLSVSLKLGELGAQAQFLSAHAQVRSAVEQAIPQLREALAAQGISLGETSVGEQHQPPRDQQAGGGSRGLSSTTPSESADSAQAPSMTVQRLALGQVDLYA